MVEVKTKDYLKELRYTINSVLKLKLEDNSKSLINISKRINEMLEEVEDVVST